MKIRAWLEAVAILWISAFTGVMAQSITIDNLVQIVSADSATSKTISWQDPSGRTDYTVEYRAADSTATSQAEVTRPKRPPIYDYDNVPPYTYGAYMQKLQPNQAYEYRISDSDGATGWFSFTTTGEDDNTYTALILGDSQSSDDYSVWGQTARLAYQAAPQAKFFVNMGDLTDNGQAWYQWRAWAVNADVLTSHMDMAPVLGNHEAYSMNWTFAEPYTYKALFAVPYNGPQDQQRLAYSFTYGDVHYVSLNTDDEELRAARPTMLRDEAAWLDADLAKATAAGKRLVVFMHRPPWNSPYDGKLSENGRYFMPIFDKYDVPLVFTAHEHCYERTEPVVAGQAAAQGTVYVATGRSGTESWDGSVRKPVDVVYYNPVDMPMYLTLQVAPNDFTVTALKNDGTVIDKAVIAAPSKVQPAATAAKEGTTQTTKGKVKS